MTTPSQVTAPQMSAEDKRALRKAKQNYELHVALIAHEKGCSPTTARMLAYIEGGAGFAKRMTPK